MNNSICRLLTRAERLQISSKTGRLSVNTYNRKQCALLHGKLKNRLSADLHERQISLITSYFNYIF